MRYDVNKQKWTPMEIKGVKGYFTDIRIDWNTVPDIFHCYELADGDDGYPCRYRSKEDGVLVNFFGTFITTEELPMEKVMKELPGRKSIGYIDDKKEWSFLGEEMSFDNVLKESNEHKAECAICIIGSENKNKTTISEAIDAITIKKEGV